MNPRIKELMIQAMTETGRLEDGVQASYQRFAELIVRECATIALREEHDPYECILSHFGVDTIDGQLRKRSTYFGNNP
jgi:hypothetical protein